MAKKSKKHKKPKKVSKSVSKEVELHSLSGLSNECMLDYSTYVLDNRTIPDFRDGFKPVNRRIIWSMYEDNINSNKPFIKAGRIVGNTMGKYHPHGDAAISGAMTEMAQALTTYPTIDGQGNWGSIFGDPAAAARYIEARLSPLVDAFVANKEYMNVCRYVPNYDGGSKEPLYIPSLVPYILAKGISGIAVGTTTNIPPFHLKGLMHIVGLALKGKKITAKTCLKHLEFAYRGDPVCVSEDDVLLELYNTGKGSVEFACAYDIDEKDPRKINLLSFTHSFKPDKVSKKLLDSKKYNVSAVADESGPDGHKITVTLANATPQRDVEDIAERICEDLITSQSYRINVSKRGIKQVKDDTTGEVRDEDDHQFRSVSVVQLLNDWVEYRIDLEKDYRTYLIEKCRERIKYLKLMRFAISKLDIIFKVLKSKSKTLNEDLAKALKISLEDARTILDKQVRSLSSMSDEELKKQMNEQKVLLKANKRDHAKPKEAILRSLEGVDFSKFSMV